MLQKSRCQITYLRTKDHFIDQYKSSEDQKICSNWNEKESKTIKTQSLIILYVTRISQETGLVSWQDDKSEIETSYDSQLTVM